VNDMQLRTEGRVRPKPIVLRYSAGNDWLPAENGDSETRSGGRVFRVTSVQSWLHRRRFEKVRQADIDETPLSRCEQEILNRMILKGDL
jgi:hypothetical protein